MVFFDPRGIERTEYQETVVIPAGEYLVCVDRASEKRTMNGMGCFVFFKVLGVQAFKDVALMNYFNLEHDNENAKKIGRLEFCRLLDAIEMGQTVLKEPTDICGKVLRVEVEVVPHHKDVTKEQNKIKKYHLASIAERERAEKKQTGGDIPF